MSQTAKIFKSGGSWAVRLPAEYRFDADKTEVFISRTAGGDVVLSTRQRPTFGDFLAYRDSLDEQTKIELADFLVDRDQPVMTDRNPLDWSEANDGQPRQES